MLELARASSRCNQDFFKGWVIAGADVAITGKAKLYNNEMLLQNKSRCVMLVQGRDDGGKVQKQLKLVLLLPRQIGVSAAAAERPEGNFVYEHIFSPEEISTYTARVGDENTLHSQPRPIVPGILLLSWLQQAAAAEFLHWKTRFLQPVYAGEQVTVYKQHGMLTGYVNGIKVFVINQE